MCALNKLRDGDLRSNVKSGGVADWSAKEIVEVYCYLSKMLDEASKAQLPPSIPLPLDSKVCVARNHSVHEGYPAKGHIIGKDAWVVEGGCPNHVLCKNCANNLVTCPECPSFVPYFDPPHGCPACPNDIKHCATFSKPCGVEGCAGGVWLPKKRPEEAKAEEPKELPKAPAEEAKVEEPKQEAKEGKAEGPAT